MMNTTTLTGIAASVFTGTSLLPQLVKILQNKKAGDISLGMLSVLFIGLACWVCYGFLKEDWIIIISNAFSLIINLMIVILALKYKNNN